jgi:GNAT superfamily N-acetyltransferase
MRCGVSTSLSLLSYKIMTELCLRAGRARVVRYLMLSNCADIRFLATRAGYERRGIAKRLMRFVIDQVDRASGIYGVDTDKDVSKLMP